MRYYIDLEESEENRKLAKRTILELVNDGMKLEEDILEMIDEIGIERLGIKIENGRPVIKDIMFDCGMSTSYDVEDEE